MKQTMKRALAVFIAALLATMGPVGALSEGIVNGAEASVSGDIVPGADSQVSGDIVTGSEESVVSEDIELPAKEVILELGEDGEAMIDEPSEGAAAPLNRL